MHQATDPRSLPSLKLVHLGIFQRGILDMQKPGMPMKHHPLWVARAEDPVRVQGPLTKKKAGTQQTLHRD